MNAARLLVLMFAALAWRGAPADTLFSNLQSDGSFPGDYLGGRIVSGGAGTYPYFNSPGYSFVAAASGSVSEIGVGIYWGSGTNAVVMTLHEAAPWNNWTGPSFGTIQPGAVLGSWTLPNIRPISPLNPQTALTKVTGISGINLLAGTSYFIKLTPAAADTYVVWNGNSTGAVGTMWQCGYATPDPTCPSTGFISYANVSSGAMEIKSADAPDASALLTALIGNVGGIATVGTSFADKLHLVQAYLAVPDVTSACSMLDDFKRQVRAQRDKRISAGVADDLTADAEAIKAAIPCP